MSLTPFTGISSFFDDPFFNMGSLMSAPFGNLGETGRQGGRMREWRPRADVTEDDRNYVIKADLPGLNKDKIKIDLDEDNGLLTLSGEAAEEQEQDQGSYHVKERFSGTFKRSFRLPKEQVDYGNIKARMENGILNIVCPKVQKQVQQKTRSLNIS